jgi:hypothetical protein
MHILEKAAYSDEANMQMQKVCFARKTKKKNFIACKTRASFLYFRAKIRFGAAKRVSPHCSARQERRAACIRTTAFARTKKPNIHNRF